MTTLKKEYILLWPKAFTGWIVYPGMNSSDLSNAGGGLGDSDDGNAGGGGRARPFNRFGMQDDGFGCSVYGDSMGGGDGWPY